jgi:hypothetical protein
MELSMNERRLVLLFSVTVHGSLSATADAAILSPGDAEQDLTPFRAQATRNRVDEPFVSRFLDDARAIFEAAESASRSGQPVSDFTLLIGNDGALQMLADSDWPLDRLLAERGARAAYRIGELSGRVRLEARSGAQTCTFESESPRAVARTLLGLSLNPLPAGNWPLLPAMSD